MEAPDIYEYDLKGFFDRVDITYVSEQLEKAGLPSSVRAKIDWINKSAPDLPETRNLPETNAESKRESREELRGIMDFLHDGE